MLYPKCPKCGGKSTTTDTTRIHPGAGPALRRGGHPVAALLLGAFSAGKAIYNRTSGEKKCTACGHRFT